MEQERFWMWTKRRHGLSSHHLQASTNCDDSWEEQAFAEDAAGTLGGCVWPPRSYSCSFCGREFRSAQALGGHMNVHRRDRARLKQSPTPHDEILHHHDHVDHQKNIQTHIQNPFLPIDFQYQPADQVCNLVYNPNPNPDHSTLPSPSSTSRVLSPPPSKENYPDDKPSVPLFSSPIVVQEHSKKSPNSSLKSWSNLVADRYYHFSDLRCNEGDKSTGPRILESGCRVIEDYVQTDSSVSLNLVVRRTRPTTSGSTEETVGCKRKKNDTPTLPLFLKPIPIERHRRVLQPADDDEVPELISPSSVDGIDLELRLGDRPKVK